eukprot:COSAG01_NODE_56439_length_318_cov_1.082192_1_plen_50_part_10
MARRNLMLVTLCLLLAGATAQWGRPDNPNTETGRECFDHKDNDGDGVSDC